MSDPNISKLPLDTTGLENASAILKAISSLKEIAEVNKKNEARKLREMAYNAASLDLNKKRKFIKYIDEARHIYHRKPEIFKYIFEHNKIESPEAGFTLTTMAMAWLEYFGLKDAITLDKMKKRIHSSIWAATHKYGASIFGTPQTKFKYLYYITTEPEDYKKQTDTIRETCDQFANAADGREARMIQLKKAKEEEEAKKKQKLIEVNNAGQQQTTESSTVQPEPEPSDNPNQKEQEGEESE
jgi:hypothetical protein